MKVKYVAVLTMLGVLISGGIIQPVCAETVDRDILGALGFHETSWNSFLAQSDTSTWQCGSLNGEVVRYQVNSDIIGYDNRNQVWLHLFTPMSSALPVTAFSLQMDVHGVITRKTVIMQACDDAQVEVMKEKIPQKVDAVPLEDVDEKTLPKTEVSQQRSMIAQDDVQVEEVPRQAHAEITENDINTSEVSVKSVAEFLVLYRQHMGDDL